MHLFQAVLDLAQGHVLYDDSAKIDLVIRGLKVTHGSQQKKAGSIDGAQPLTVTLSAAEHRYFIALH